MTSPAQTTQDLLAELERRWRELDLALVDRLQPGLRDEQIDALTAPLGVRLSGEARTWWGWHDGVPASSIRYRRERAMTGSGLESLPLEEAVRAAQQGQRMAIEVAGEEGDRLWRPSWLPFAENSGGTVAVFDCARSDTFLTPIHAVDWHWIGATVWGQMGESACEPQVASLAELVGWWVRAFDEGAYHYDADTGMLLTDPHRLDAAEHLRPLV